MIRITITTLVILIIFYNVFKKKLISAILSLGGWSKLDSEELT